jgi:positive regulator of sigma E activity
MTEKGTVLSASGGIAKIRLLKSEECEKCGVCSSGKNDEFSYAEAKYDIDISEGDTVLIKINPGFVLKFSFLLYILPLISAVLGYVAVFSIFKKEGAGILASVIFLVLSFVLLFVLNDKKRKNVYASVEKKL